MRETRFRSIVVGVVAVGILVTVAILVPPPGPVEDRTHTDTDDGSELTAVIRVVDPDGDSVAPPLLPNGMAPQLDEPYGQIEIDMSDPRIADPEGFLRGDYDNVIVED